ncbi:MAG: GNAT family N-acetyltransferase [Planctomycetota bacterium]
MSGNYEPARIEIQQLTEDHLATWRTLRLHALRDRPDAFGSTYEAEAVLDDEGWAAKWQSWIGSPGGVWAAMQGEKPVGLVGCVCDHEAAGRAWLISMWVAPAVRGRGLGKALITSAIRWAKDQGLKELRLEVTSNNPVAAQLYSRMGFVMTGSSAPHPRNPALREKEMLLVL